MKKTLQTLSLLFAIQIAFAQTGNIGIGTASPDASAMMEISSTNKGLLIPRLNLSTSAPSSPASYLLVFNTDNAFSSGVAGVNGSGIGYFFNSGTSSAPVWYKIPSQVDVAALIANSTTGRTLTMTGTANQVSVTNSGVAQDLSANRAWTFSLPQNIHTAASPTFTGATLSGLSVAGIVTNTAAGVLATTATVPIANGGTGQSTKTTAFNALTPMTTLGDIEYHNGTNGVRLAGNTTVTKKVLTQTGNGTVSAAPTWGALANSDLPGAALTKTDDANVTLALGGTPSTALLNATSLTLGWTGVLATSRGGLGANMTAGAIGAIPYSTSTTAYGTLADVATGNSLISGGVGVAPSWGKIGLTTHVSGILPVANGGTGTSTQNWVDLTTAQTAAGVKTWSNNALFKGTVSIDGALLGAVRYYNSKRTSQSYTTSGAQDYLSLTGVPAGTYLVTFSLDGSGSNLLDYLEVSFCGDNASGNTRLTGDATALFSAGKGVTTSYSTILTTTGTTIFKIRADGDSNCTLYSGTIMALRIN